MLTKQNSSRTEAPCSKKEETSSERKSYCITDAEVLKHQKEDKEAREEEKIKKQEKKRRESGSLGDRRKNKKET